MPLGGYRGAVFDRSWCTSCMVICNVSVLFLFQWFFYRPRFLKPYLLHLKTAEL